MVSGIAGVAPDRDLGRPSWREWVGVQGRYGHPVLGHTSATVGRDCQLRCEKPVRQGNLVGVKSILQVNSTVGHPAQFQLAVPPQGGFSREVPLPTVGLFRAGVQPLVGYATQNDVKRAPLRGAY